MEEYLNILEEAIEQLREIAENLRFVAEQTGDYQALNYIVAPLEVMIETGEWLSTNHTIPKWMTAIKEDEEEEEEE